MSTMKYLSLEEALADTPHHCAKQEALARNVDFNVANEQRLVTRGKVQLELDMADVDDGDQYNRYKLRFAEKLKREGNERVLKEVLQHIKRSTTTPAWFEYILPKEEKVPVDESENNIVSKKYFSCPRCDYSTNHHNDLGKHIRRRHGDQVKVPQNTNQLECPDCGKVLKCLRKHRDLQRSKMRRK